MAAGIVSIAHTKVICLFFFLKKIDQSRKRALSVHTVIGTAGSHIRFYRQYRCRCKQEKLMRSSQVLDLREYIVDDNNIILLFFPLSSHTTTSLSTLAAPFHAISVSSFHKKGVWEILTKKIITPTSPHI